MGPKIQNGTATYMGIILSIGALVTPLVNEVVALIENTQHHWTGGEKTAVIAGAAVAGVTMLGKFAQAVAVIIKSPRV